MRRRVSCSSALMSPAKNAEFPIICRLCKGLEPSSISSFLRKTLWRSPGVRVLQGCQVRKSSERVLSALLGQPPTGELSAHGSFSSNLGMRGTALCTIAFAATPG